MIGRWLPGRKCAGFIDNVSSRHIRGWASCPGEETIVVVTIPGFPKMTLYPDHDREDVAQAGFSLRSGFQLPLRRALPEGTKVSITFPDGRHLTNSPWLYSEGKEQRQKWIDSDEPAKIDSEDSDISEIRKDVSDAAIEN
jgi:hypothetical protein